MRHFTALLLVGSALLLGSCNRTGVPATSPDEAAGKVVELSFNETTGAPTYSPWSGGAGKVIASVDGENALVKADLKADGSFSLTLPKLDASLLVGADPSDLTPDLPDSCTGSLSTSGATDAKSAGVTFSVDAQLDGGIAPFTWTETTNSLTLETGAYVYFDRAVGLSGKITCIENNTPVTGDINVQFQPGWNKVSLAVKATTQGATVTGATVTMKTGNVPNTWVYLGDAATPLSLQSQSIKGQTLKRQSLNALKTLHLPFFR